MSQQSQAEALHQEGVQCFEEARAALVKLDELERDGTLSAEAKISMTTEINSKTGRGEELLERARQLNTIDRGQTDLATLAPDGDDTGDHRPEYLRPRGGDGVAVMEPEGMLAGQTAQQFFNPRGALYGMSPEELGRVSRMCGIDAGQFSLSTGKVRRLLNRYLRQHYLHSQNKTHLMCSPEAVEFLERGGQPARAAQATAQYEGLEELNVGPYVDSDGGSVVGHEVRNEIIRHMRDQRHIRTMARVISTTAGSVSMPVFKLRVSLKKTRAHKGKVDGSDPVNIREILGKEQFTPHGKMEIVQVPRELVDDMTMDLVSFIAEEIALESFDDEESEFLNGTGNNESHGVLSALRDTSQAIDIAGSGAAIDPDDIKRLPFALREVFLQGAVWMANRSFFELVSVMRTDAGAGPGTGNYLFQPGLRAGDPNTLVGFEVRRSEFFPDHIGGLGGASQVAGDPMALLGNWGSFWIVDRQGFEIRTLPELYAEKMLIGFQYTKRFDAAPVRLESWVTLVRT